MMDHGWQRFHDMEDPNKGLQVEEGIYITNTNIC